MCQIVDVACENMDEKTSGSSKVDAVIHAVTFYPQSSHTSSTSFRKTVPGVHMKRSACTASDLVSRDVSFNCSSVQKTIGQSGGRKSTVLDKRPKSIESAKRTKSKYRLVRKPKHTLLPYKRGQLKFCTESGNVIVRSRAPVALNSQSAEKENKTYSDDCNASVSTGKLNMRGDTSRRFFKATFSKRRQFTLSMPGVTTSHTKLSQLKQHERNAALRSKQLHFTATNDSCKSENVMESATECCKNDLSTVSDIDTTVESLCEDAACKNTEVAVEGADGSVESDSSSQNAGDAECVVPVPDNLCSSSDADKCPIASSSNVVDHSMASLVKSASDSGSYSDSAVTSPSLKHGTFLLLYF